MKLARRILFSLIALVTIFAAFYLVAKHYFSFYPPLGNDFYHSFNLINFFRNNPAWPHLSWRNIWYFGGPSLINYPWLNFYLVQPLVKVWGLYQGTMYYFLASLFLYGLTSGLIFYILSGSFLLSLGLAVSLLWSASSWRLLVAGSLALAANQFLFAMAFLLTISYLKSSKKNYLRVGALAAGLSAWSQSASAFPFIIPSILILILFWTSDKKNYWPLRKKIIDSGSFLLLSLLVALFYFYHLFVHRLGIRGKLQVFDWMKKEAFSAIFTKTNPMLFILLVIFLLTAIGFNVFKNLRRILPFAMVFLYLLVFNLLSIYGLNPVGSDFAPAENWYILTFLLTAMTAILWRGIRPNLQKYFSGWLISLITLASFVILLAPFGLWQVQSLLQDFKGKNFICGIESAEVVHQALVKDDFSGLSKNFPQWVDREDNNWRFFSLSWCVDLWWNALHKLPLVTGYSGLTVDRFLYNYLAWMSDIFDGSMAERAFDPVIVKNNALFYIDWLGGRYIERIADDLAYLEDPEIVKLDNKPAGYRIYEFQDNIISPIIRPTNVPAVLVVSSQSGYDTILRVLAQENLNSRFLIPIKGSPYIEDLTRENLDDFEAIILYDYHYKKEKNFQRYPQESWDYLADYVRNGGNLILETGSEVKESDIRNLPRIEELPEVFPINKTQEEELGKSWQLTKQNSQLLAGVDEAEFAPLDYDGKPWKLSISSQAEVRPWATSVLTQQGKPILVQGQLGQGQVIWSGMTLPYHIQTYHNLTESHLFRNWLVELVDIREEKVLPFEFGRNQSEHISLAVENVQGVLFKENFNAGWAATVTGQRLRLYPAGFGFMYACLPDVISNGEQTIKLDYRGDPKYKVMFYISVATIIFIIGRLFFTREIKLKSIIKPGRVKAWWSREDE